MVIIPQYLHLDGCSEGRCRGCGAAHTSRPIFEVPPPTDQDVPARLCHACWEAACDQGQVQEKERALVTAEELQEKLGALVVDSLRRGGVDSQALLADPKLIPAVISNGLPEDAMKAVAYLKAGGIPLTGLCLAGPTDGGKTLTVASWLISWCANRLRRQAPLEGVKKRFPRPKPVFAWVHMIDWNTGLHANDPGEDGVVPLGEVPLLVLDDLGTEDTSVVSSACRGRAALARLFAMRERENRPTFITTNLTMKEIYQRYGDRIARRIFRINPYVVFEDLPVMGRVNHVQSAP